MLLVSLALAEDYSADPTNFAQLLAAALDGDRFFLEPGEYLHPATVGVDVTVVGNGAVPSDVVFRRGSDAASVVRFQGYSLIVYENVRFDGQDLYRSVQVNSGVVTLRNVELVDGHASGAGGNLLVTTAGTLLCERCVLRDGTSLTDGGNLAVTGRATLTDSTIEGGEATHGGGVDVAIDATLDLIDVVLFGNHASVDGGALRTSHNTTVVRGRFCENEADQDGGAVAAWAGALDARNVMFFMNSSGSRGGAIAADGGILGLSQLTLLGNTAGELGGAVSALPEALVTLERSIVAENSSPEAVLYAQEAPVTPLALETLFWLNASTDTNWSTAATVSGDPQIVGGCGPDDGWLLPGNAAVDVAPNVSDLDGSPGDLGITGGPDAPAAPWVDADGDEFPAWLDCDPDAADVFPGATERCGLVDHDCDGVLGDEDPDAVGRQTWFEDRDGDGWGGELIGDECVDPGGVLQNGDCDDTMDSAHPGAVEIADNGVDEDCDGADLVVDGPGRTRFGLGCVSAPGAATWGASLLALGLVRRRERALAASLDCRR